MAISDALYLALAKAKSQPSRAYRAAQAGLDIPRQAIEGYKEGSELGDVIHKRRQGRMTLEELLGGTIEGLPQQLQRTPLNAMPDISKLAPFITKEIDPIDQELRRELIQARIDSLRTPNPPKPPNPLDDEYKRAKIEALKKGPGSEKSVQDAFGLYTQAMKGLTSSLEKTSTGPIVGRIPAFTAEQQAADSAVASMAPVLKQLFRVAGEGVFTDRDQALLLKMVTDRTIRPEARATVMKNVDNIVRAKLGIPIEDSRSLNGSKVKVSNGSETLEIDPADIPEAVRDGYKPVP